MDGREKRCFWIRAREVPVGRHWSRDVDFRRLLRRFLDGHTRQYTPRMRDSHHCPQTQALIIPMMAETVVTVPRSVPGKEVSVIPDEARAGAYVLHLTVNKRINMRIRTLGAHELAEGWYLYVGSARRGMASRCARHERLPREKAGKIRWHIDYLLVHPNWRLARIDSFPGAEECSLSRRIACRKGIGWGHICQM